MGGRSPWAAVSLEGRGGGGCGEDADPRADEGACGSGIRGRAEGCGGRAQVTLWKEGLDGEWRLLEALNDAA